LPKTVFFPVEKRYMKTFLKNNRKRFLTYPQAIKEAVEQEMARDCSVIVMGMGVDDPKAILGTTKGFLGKFGESRVFDTPLAEDGMTGVAIGAALAGLRPIHVHIRMDFLLLAMNQLVNMAAKIHYMFGGSIHLPLVIRAIIGKSWGQGPQHSQSLYPLIMNIPGIKIFAPSTPYDAKGCMISAIRDNNPVLFIEHRMLYYQRGFVPEKAYTIPFGKTRILAKGDDITLVGISQMAVECLRASLYLKEVGISAEVIDPLCLCPLDTGIIKKSAARTKRIIVVDNAWQVCAAGSEIIARIFESDKKQDILAKRMGFAPVPCPTSPALEKYFYPDSKAIAVEAFNMLYPNKKRWYPRSELNIEEVEFKGPF
jgi:pyruvate/2-oxoglutarate/acetoin dehydrogenase E1 component